jgi:hypothetical protein
MLSILLCALSLRAQDSTKETSVSSISITSKPVFSIFGGTAIPMGDYSDPNIGAANAGFTFGVQLVTGIKIGFLLNASYTSNPTNIRETIESMGGSGSSGNWKSLLLLTGLKFGTTEDIGPNFFFAPVIGVNFVSSPNVDYSVTETFPGLVLTENYSTASVSGSAFAYGAMIELDAKRITLGARYVVSNPTFHYSTKYTESTGVSLIREGSSQQKVSFLQIIVGVAF